MLVLFYLSVYAFCGVLFAIALIQKCTAKLSDEDVVMIYIMSIMFWPLILLGIVFIIVDNWLQEKGW